MTNEKAKALQDEAAKARRATEIADLQEVMGTQAGRRFVWKLLGDAGVFRMSMNPNFGVTAFAEGQRSVGNALYADLHEHCFDQYQEMEREARVSETTLKTLQNYEDN